MLIPLAANRADLHYVWRGPSLFAITADGGAGRHRLTGFFFRQNHFLREFRLELNGQEPRPCSIAEIAANELALSFVFPPVQHGDGGGSGSGAQGSQGGLLYRDVSAQLTVRVRPASLQIVLELTNHWQTNAEIDVAWEGSAHVVRQPWLESFSADLWGRIGDLAETVRSH